MAREYSVFSVVKVVWGTPYERLSESTQLSSIVFVKATAATLSYPRGIIGAKKPD
jgi:hypothetical protein